MRCLRRGEQEDGMSGKIEVSLCGGDKCCPVVELDAAKKEVKIGEEGNLVVLDKRAWNTLVEKIQSGELKAI